MNLTSPPLLTIIAERGLHDGNGLRITHLKVSEYPVVAEIQNEYTPWRGNGWLMLYPEDKLGPPKGLIPLMAIL